jgi:L-fuculokinase
MTDSIPRGIAVVDVGYTNMKIALFSPEGKLVAKREALSRHVEGPPYRHIDPQPMEELCRLALPELDGILPIDAIVPCAHGAAMACLDRAGNLALPVMDYTENPPYEVVEEYKRIAPGFDETFCTLLPMALTHGLQLFWQQQSFPAAFAQTKALLPWIQYVGFKLCGVPVLEISSMSCQTHLMNTRTQELSSLVNLQGWNSRFPRFAKAWETIGTLLPEFRGSMFRGQGRVLAGVHDSTANFMRYVCAGLDSFTLVSTGTWSISFDPETSVIDLDEARDTNTNTDVLGRTVACSRFFGGKEFEIVSGGAPAELASLDMVTKLVGQPTYACPSFTDSGGPVPRTGMKGRILGKPVDAPPERAALAALYCAQMVSEQLDAISSRNDIIVDGPFSQNGVLLAILAQLRPNQRIFASDLRDGTTAGAAAIALIDNGRLPVIGLTLSEVRAATIPGLEAYHSAWREKAYESAD